MPEFKIDKRFDEEKKRHYVNDFLIVLHCHHYATLFTQLALDARDLVNGTEILFKTTESVFSEVLEEYFKKNSITDEKEKISIAIDMFSKIGMGKIEKAEINDKGGEIVMSFAYVDEGWLKKWGKYPEPVNYIGQGYIAGMLSAIYGKPAGSYKVSEEKSRVKGDEKSVLKASA